MRRLNERVEDFLEFNVWIKIKCMDSDFNVNITNEVTNLANKWKSRFGPNKSSTHNNTQNLTSTTRITRATSFPQSLRLANREKNLQPLACVTYKRPPTIAIF